MLSLNIHKTKNALDSSWKLAICIINILCLQSHTLFEFFSIGNGTSSYFRTITPCPRSIWIVYSSIPKLPLCKSPLQHLSCFYNEGDNILQRLPAILLG